MAMKVNGIDGDFSVPRVIGSYKFVKFEANIRALVDGVEKSVDIKKALNTAWKGVVSRSQGKRCNEYFKSLRKGKSLEDVLKDGDIVLHCLETLPGRDENRMPNANTAGRDIGINPVLFFDSNKNALTCTLVHELAHVAGASTNPSAPREESHAAELSLMSCECSKVYSDKILGSIEFLDTGKRYV